MTIERLDPDRLAVAGGDDADIRRFIESDFKIRSGMCPNGCGLLIQADGLQECQMCHFSTNKLAEKGRAQ